MKALFLFLLCASQLRAQSRTFDITQFGAKADGQTLNTSAIKAAIQACHAAGGGTVRVPAGVFRSGTVRLLDNVHLHLDAGAVLQGSPNVADYEPKRGVLFAYEARNVGVTGPGTVDGNGDVFFDAKRMHGFRNPGFDRKYTRQGERYLPADTFFPDGPIYYDRRPGMLVEFSQCENVTVHNTTFAHSPSWTFRFADCDGVLVQGIRIRDNILIPNSDGIHCTTSRNVRIADCDIFCGDDAIAITGFNQDTDSRNPGYYAEVDYTKRTIGNRTGACENIVLSNCILQSASSGIRIGYGPNPIRNCRFQNVIIADSHRGIGIFNRDRATIENISFDHISIQTRLYSGHWWGKGEPIHVSSVRHQATLPVGVVRNIQFSNVVAESESGVVLWGTAESRLQNLRFDNVQLTITSGPNSADWGGNFDLRPSALADQQLFKHDIPGIFAARVDGLTLRDVTVRWGSALSPYFTHALEIEESTGVRLEQFGGIAARSEVPATKFTKTVFAKP